ncbi:MAG: MoaD/ThiS family protein [Granulosicoccus sp.]|nr:MoaD/ThiS family protein [Granulosicoccus sp.]
MKITFKLYATLQDLLPAGAVKNAVEIDIPDDATLNSIIDQYKVPRELAHLVLVNGVFHCDTDRDKPGMLVENDVLAIWPPVAGG